VVVGLGKVAGIEVVGEELEIVSVRWRVMGLLFVLLFWIILALERSRGRQLGSC
jgi:uncharacterized membrane-anchored protein